MIKDNYTLEYPCCGGWLEPEQLAAALEHSAGTCRTASFSTLSIPLDAQTEQSAVQVGINWGEKWSRTSPRCEQAVDIGSSLCWRADAEQWRAFAEHLNRFSTPVRYPAYEIRHNGTRIFSSDPCPEERFAALHKRARICLEEAPHHEFGLFSCDLAFVVPEGGGPDGGVHLFAGGGGGIWSGSPALGPRAASWLGLYSLPEALRAAEMLVMLNERFGETDNMRKRRLKSLFASRGLEWVEAELRKAGVQPGRGECPEFLSAGEWSREERYNDLLVAVPSGRMEDGEGYPLKTALQNILPDLTSPVRITPYGNLRIHPDDRASAIRLNNLLKGGKGVSPVAVASCACRGLPACRRARAASSAIRRELVGCLEEILHECGLDGEPVIFRISGCPNGCSRPLFAELALVGRSEGVYDVFAGGRAQGDRTASLLRRAVPVGEVKPLFQELFHRFAGEKGQEGRLTFGDWIHAAMQAGEDGGIPRERREER